MEGDGRSAFLEESDIIQGFANLGLILIRALESEMCLGIKEKEIGNGGMM